MPATSVRRLAGATLATFALGIAIAVGSTLAGPALAEPSEATTPSGVDARTRAFSGFDNSVLLVGPAPVTMSLDVPAGKYAVHAKVTVTSSDGGTTRVSCRLVAFGGFDEADVVVSTMPRDQTMALQVVDELPGPRAIRLTCSNGNGTTDTELTFVKITALKVQSTSVTPLDVS